MSRDGVVCQMSPVPDLPNILSKALTFVEVPPNLAESPLEVRYSWCGSPGPGAALQLRIGVGNVSRSGASPRLTTEPSLILTASCDEALVNRGKGQFDAREPGNPRDWQIRQNHVG